MIDAELGPELEAYVQQLIDRGRYSSRQEVLKEGVRLLQQRERQADFRAMLDRGIADSDNNRGRPMRDVVNELLSTLDKRQEGS